jgi:serine-type D-Ala-D-Ala carboxypeptidase (penicillin-binding protein 5/6)
MKVFLHLGRSVMKFAAHLLSSAATRARAVIQFALLLATVVAAQFGALPALAAAEFTIKAQQAILVDADSGAVMFQYKPDELAQPASMSKLMTLAVVFRSLKAGTLKLDDDFLMSEGAWRRGGGPSGTSAMFVPLNTRAKVADLLRGIIIQSGNDAAIAIAEGLGGTEDAFAEIMTTEARRIGLKKSTFKNATGLYADGHLMSVRELAQLGRYIIREYPDYYAIFQEREFNYTETKAPFKKHRFINRNPLIFMNIGADGMKTGHIKESGYGIVGSAVQDGRRLIVVVNGLASEADRKEEARRLLEWGFKSFAEFKLFEAGETVGRARVWGGDSMYVNLTGNGALNVMLPRQPTGQKLKGEIVYQGPLKAPIRKGDQVALLRVTSSTEASSEVPLFAAEDVERASTLRRGLDTLLVKATSWLP